MMVMKPIRGPQATPAGWTPLVVDFPVRLGLVRLEGDAPFAVDGSHEVGLVLIHGEGRVTMGDRQWSASRSSLFDGPGHAWLAPAGTSVHLSGNAEWAVVSTSNPLSFEAMHVGPDACRNEDRGRGGLEDTAFRWVRTYVDRTHAPPEARLVLGEVHNLQGRWSSYPPHHHPQPEIYHYRFSDVRGYGHAEHGDEVMKVRQGDTLCIEGGHVHSQCAAPGYDMFYLWAIRHLDGRPYDKPTFDPEHRWILER